MISAAAKNGSLSYTLPHNRAHILERLYKITGVPNKTGRQAAEIYTILT